MRSLLVFALFLLSFSLVAKQAPKWKDANFKKSTSGLQFRIVKYGKGDSISDAYWVSFDLFFYDSNGKPKNSIKLLRHEGSVVDMNDSKIVPGITESLRNLRKGAKAFFIIPPALSGGIDTIYCFIHVKRIGLNNLVQTGPSISVVDTKQDSVTISVPDPAKKFFGDTLFSFMKLIEVPQVANCGIIAINVAFKFELTWYENGSHHKDVLIFVECPEKFGKDFFKEGSSYMVTAVPMIENYKQGHNTMNSYSLEKLDSYYSLRIKKM